MESSPQPFLFELDGGRVSLDFANTVGGIRGYSPKERLHGYGDLLEFARQAGVVSDAHARRLAARAEADPAAAERVFRRAIEFREALYRVWQAHVEHRPLPQDDLKVVDGMVKRSLTRQRLIPYEQGKCCTFAWEEEDDPEALLWPIAKDAGELLTSEQATRVRICEMSQEHECGWVFLDETKSGSKRWCSMASCGNRAKARRHRQKQGA